MNRRRFLASAALLATVPRAVVGAQARPRTFVPGDAAPLRRVLVHEPGAESRKVIPFGGGEHAMLGLDVLGEAAAGQHAGVVRLLQEAGVEVLAFGPLLQQAVERAREEGQLRPWLDRVLPRLAPHEPLVGAAAILGADAQFIYRADERGVVHRLVDPLRCLCFLRDAAVMTPRGLVLGRLVNNYRALEPELVRFLTEWSEPLAYPIAFDARAERVYLQGGDLIVADADTLWLGVGNLTSEEAAPRLARALDMEVVAVELPGDHGGLRGGANGMASWNGLRTQFLHLDTLVNLTGPREVVAVPCFLEQRHARRHPLNGVLHGLIDDPDIFPRYIQQLERSLERVGRVRVYRRGSGEPDATVGEAKFVDYLRDRGYTVRFVGGAPPEGRDLARHLIELVLPELRFQGANVVATGPNRVIGCTGTPRTTETLRGAGVAVATVDAGEFVRWHGGPHCLTLPLERG
jgi:arginine deiminase